MNPRNNADHTVPAGIKKLMELITFKIINAKDILSNICNFFISALPFRGLTI